jgi:pyruvate,water dikinase
LNDFVSVRSSAASEDGELNTFAGLHDTFLNIQNNPINIIEAIKKCWASLFNERALLYRIKKELPIFEGMAVVVQNMIQAECSGVVYTKHPIENKYILVESAFGIGDTVVDGKIKPDSFLIERDTLNVANSELGRKYSKTQIENGVHTVSINEDTETFSINESVLNDLVVMCLRIEQIFGKTQDIEWAYDGTLWFLQSRTVNF